MKRFSLACLLFVFVGCSSTDSASSNTVAGIVAKTANLNTLEQALETSDLTDLFADPTGEYTLFAPTDEAFAAFGTLPEGETLVRVLQYHALSERKGSSDLRANTTGFLDTIEEGNITLKVENGKIFLNDTTELVTQDLEASNGVVHIINKVLTIPPSQ
jgi:transforming growth factor-beta-induced protein